MKTDDPKYHTKQIGRRFLAAMGEILTDRSNGKVTMLSFGKVVGMESSNITRMQRAPDTNFVTLEAVGRLCEEYGYSGN